MKKSEELSDDERLYLKALYQLSLEACGGNMEVLHSFKDQKDIPKIDHEDIMKRFEELKKKENETLQS